MPHVQHNSGKDGWFTPPTIARRVLGVFDNWIDLDPASCEDANKLVRAQRYYTKEDNGLKYDWIGNVYLNPPYKRKVIEAFIHKFITEYQLGNMLNGIVVTNNATETKWGQALLKYSDAVCFPNGRIHFWPDSTNSTQTKTPLQGQMICFVGSHECMQAFIGQFQSLGQVFVK